MIVKLCILAFIVSGGAKQLIEVSVPAGYEIFGGPRQTGLVQDELLAKSTSYARATQSPKAQDLEDRTTGQMLRMETAREHKGQWPDWVNDFLPKITSYDRAAQSPKITSYDRAAQSPMVQDSEDLTTSVLEIRPGGFLSDLPPANSNRSSASHQMYEISTWEPPPDVGRFDLAEIDYSESDSGTPRLGNYLNEWILSSTCESQPRGEPIGECHGCPGVRFDKVLRRLDLWWSVVPGTLGAFLLDRRPAVAADLIRFCNGPWWWSYSYEAWRELGALFQAELRPKAAAFAAEKAPSCSDCHPNIADADSLVVHYRLGQKDNTITVQALMRGVETLYSEFHIAPPRKITVLAGSYHHDMPGDGDDLYTAECEKRRASLVEELQKRFPQADVRDTYGNGDEDWLRMAFAPVLVTTQGSYAVSAAAVNAGYRATAGCPNLNFPSEQLGRTVIKDIGKNWITYKLQPGDVVH